MPRPSQIANAVQPPSLKGKATWAKQWPHSTQVADAYSAKRHSACERNIESLRLYSMQRAVSILGQSLLPKTDALSAVSAPHKGGMDFSLF